MNQNDHARLKQLGAQNPWLVEHLQEMLKGHTRVLVRHHQVDVLHTALRSVQQLEELISFLSPSSP